MSRFDQAIKDAGLTAPDKSDPLYRAILIAGNPPRRDTRIRGSGDVSFQG